MNCALCAYFVRDVASVAPVLAVRLVRLRSSLGRALHARPWDANLYPNAAHGFEDGKFIKAKKPTKGNPDDFES